MNSYHVKYKCLQELQDGTLKPREAAKKYNVNNRTISRWKADADSIRQRVESAPPGAKLTRKPRADFKRKERPLSKDERRFKTFIEARSKISKLRMADVIAKCQQLLPTSAGKQGHNLYMYVFRWLRRHQLMECVAFNTTGRPKAHTSDEDNDDDMDADDRDEAADAAFYDAAARPSNDDSSSSEEEGASSDGGKSAARSDEMSVIYALTALAEGSGNSGNMSKKAKKTPAAKEPPAQATTQSTAAQGDDASAGAAEPKADEGHATA